MGVWQFDTPRWEGLAAVRMPKAQPAMLPPKMWLYLLHGMGIETGIDLDKLVDIGQKLARFGQTKWLKGGNSDFK